MSDARRARANVRYRGRIHHVMDFSYTDNYDKTDDMSVQFSDRDERWLNEWFPDTGETLDVEIEVLNWNSRGDNRTLSLGTFEIDNPRHSSTMSMNGVAAPVTSSARSEKKNRSWKKISLSGIAGDISGTAGLALVYDTDVDPFYDVADQNDKSDLEFLEELCKSDGLCMKVTNCQLIVFEEAKYEAEPAVVTIEKGRTNIIGDPDFNRNAKDIYKACEISYFCPKTDETYIGYFAVPNAPDVGHTLRLRGNYNAESDDINLDRKARARAREKNKYEWTCRITLNGDITYFTGTNVEFVGWGRFDGKYHIDVVAYSNSSSGFDVTLTLHRCLEGY